MVLILGGHFLGSKTSEMMEALLWRHWNLNWICSRIMFLRLSISRFLLSRCVLFLNLCSKFREFYFSCLVLLCVLFDIPPNRHLLVEFPSQSFTRVFYILKELVSISFLLHMTSFLWVQTKHLLMGAIALEGFGGLLFTVGSSVGAYLLVCCFPQNFVFGLLWVVFIAMNESLN